jgi:16S rRNA (guanine1207-N2)-methyltransferase
MSDYYAFRQIPVLLCGEPAVVIGKPGVWSWDAVNPGTAALIDTMDPGPRDKVLDLGCGTGLIGLAAARVAHQGWVTLVDVNIAAVQCAQRTLDANGVKNADVQLGSGVDVIDHYDLVLSHLPRGRAAVSAMIRDAVGALKPGGRFYLVAHKRTGVKSAIDSATQALGQVGVVRKKSGYHVALGVKQGYQPDSPVVPQRDDFERFDIILDGKAAAMIGHPGVFAWNRLDDGTAALVQSMAVMPQDCVLDLGCGTGLVALAAARRGGRVTAVDADIRAVESTRRTLAANHVDGEALISDCAQAVLHRRFDVILCNPPFHQGTGVEYDVARQMVRDAAQVLQAGGRFYLVSNVFLRYERDMVDHFSEIEEVFNDRRYRVVRARR